MSPWLHEVNVPATAGGEIRRQRWQPLGENTRRQPIKRWWSAARFVHEVPEALEGLT